MKNYTYLHLGFFLEKSEGEKHEIEFELFYLEGLGNQFKGFSFVML